MADIGNTSVFSQTDDSNTNTGTGPGFTGTMAPNAFDNNMRKLQGAITRDFNRRNPTLTSGGSANAYTLTHTVAPSGYYNGEQYTFKANHTNTGASTLNVNSLGATNIKYMVSGTATALPANVIINGAIVTVYYSTADTAFLLFAQSDMIGDSGSGGGRGLVPAPASGDAATKKALLADGTWGASASTVEYLVSQSTLSGASTVINSTTINKVFRRLLILINGASHNSGSNQSITVELSSDNGSTYSAAVSVNLAGAAAATADVAVDVLSAEITAGSRAIISNTINNFASLVGGPVNTIRVKPTGGSSWDAGTISLYGYQ